MTPKTLTVLAEILGFLASVALTYQTVRLLRHQRTVRDLRIAVENIGKLKASASSDKESRREAIELAEEGVKALEGSISRWDKRDQYFVFVGLGGLMLSFGLKLYALYLEP